MSDSPARLEPYGSGRETGSAGNPVVSPRDEPLEADGGQERKEYEGAVHLRGHPWFDSGGGLIQVTHRDAVEPFAFGIVGGFLVLVALLTGRGRDPLAEKNIYASILGRPKVIPKEMMVVALKQAAEFEKMGTQTARRSVL